MKKDLIDIFMDKIANLIGKVLLEDTVESVLKKELSEKDFEKILKYGDKVNLTHRPYSRSQALRWAGFKWEESPEGYAYWERIHNQLWVKDRIQKRLLKVRKALLICGFIIFIITLYKLFTL